MIAPVTLRELRLQKQWSLPLLAQSLGISPRTLNAIETGRYLPSLPLALRLARLLDQPVETLFAEPR